MARRVYSTGPAGRIDDEPSSCPSCDAAPCRCPASTPAGSTVFVERQRRGRKGKTVTSVGPLPLSREEAMALAGMLKRRCGSGGTLRSEPSPDGRVQLHLEIQGDHAERLQRELSAHGLAVKRRGG